MEHEHHENHEETHHSSAKKRNRKHLVVIIIAAIVIVLAAILTWLYTGQTSGAKEKVFKSLPLPAAFVDMKTVTAKYVLGRVNLSKKLMAAQGLGKDVNAADIYKQIIDAKKIEAVASKHNVTISDSEIDEEYKNIVQQYAGGDENAFKDELVKTYEMTPELFKKEIVFPKLVQSNLMLWYTQQKDLNKDAYGKAEELVNKINGGQSFDDVAKAYTEDPATKDFAGDSGMLVYEDLLPEFRDVLNDVKIGDVRIVASRYGLHILKVLEQNNDGPEGKKQIHLQQLFVKPTGFDQWLTQETDSVRVIELLKF